MERSSNYEVSPRSGEMDTSHSKLDAMEQAKQPLLPTSDKPAAVAAVSLATKVLILLAIQNCSKNLLMRYVMKDRPKFLTSAAVIGVEVIKLVLCLLYIFLVDKKGIASIIQFFKDDWRNTLLMIVPASAYSLQMSLEYVALANLNAAVFSVVVQSKLLFTATFAAIVLGKKLRHIQVISLVLLTAGVMMCNLKTTTQSSTIEEDENSLRGIMATLGIALSSGLASVYTEKVIKKKRRNNMDQKTAERLKTYSLAYTQVQLAVMCLITIGVYAVAMDYRAIRDYGLWQNFNTGAFVSIWNSAIGGLIVAAVLKYADSVLKGYATAISVVMTGVLSTMLFGTQLNLVYAMGIVNVIAAVLLYNGKDLEKFVC